jgi:cell division protein FtsB
LLAGAGIFLRSLQTVASLRYRCVSYNVDSFCVTGSIKVRVYNVTAINFLFFYQKLVNFLINLLDKGIIRRYNSHKELIMSKRSSALFFIFALFVFAAVFVNCKKQTVNQAEQVINQEEQTVNQEKQVVNQYDTMLDNLEKTVDEYVAIMNRVKAGNIYALQDATEKLNEMNPIFSEIGAKIDLMSEAQRDRFMKIAEKQQSAGLGG